MMDSSNDSKRVYLEVCAEFIEKRFGKSLDFVSQPDYGYLTAGRITPLDGGTVCKFDETNMTWFESGQDSTYWNIEVDGEVRVGYPEDDPSEGVLCFHVGHPREAAELLHLFVQPSKRLMADVSESRFMKLGKIADLYALMPSAAGWRVLDLARLPKNMPDGLRTALALNLTQNWERLSNGEGCAVWQFEERWPDFVGGLPDAAPYLRAGYLFNPDCCLRLGYSLLNGSAGEPDPFLGTLFVARDDVSSMFLGEYFEYDQKMLKHVQDAFGEENDLETICAMLTKTSICMPSEFVDQIKVAAQTNLLRQSVVERARHLIYGRAPYRHFGVRYQAAGHALGRMADACRSCSEIV